MMTSRQLVLFLIVGLLFVGCAAKPLPSAVRLPPPSVATSAISSRVQESSRHVETASEKVGTITKVIERLIPTVDAATAKELESVQSELFRVNVELRDAKEQAEQAAAAVIQSETGIASLRAWGEARQEAEIANGEGWRRCAAELDKEKVAARENQKHLLKLQSMIGLCFGITAAIAGMKFFGPHGLLAGPVAWGIAYFL